MSRLEPEERGCWNRLLLVNELILLRSGAGVEAFGASSPYRSFKRAFDDGLLSLDVSSRRELVWENARAPMVGMKAFGVLEARQKACAASRLVNVRLIAAECLV